MKVFYYKLSFLVPKVDVLSGHRFLAREASSGKVENDMSDSLTASLIFHSPFTEKRK